MAREVYNIEQNETKINGASMLDTSEKSKTGGCLFVGCDRLMTTILPPW